MSDGPDGETCGEWERVGRQLLTEQLERVAMDDVQDTFIGAARELAAGEDLDEADITAMREALDSARYVVELAAEATPGAVPEPNLWQMLDEDTRRAYYDEWRQRAADVEEGRQ